jgi:hypothetical protein
MALSKDRLRKIHGVAEPTGPADQAVLARRKYHEAAATWLARRSYILQAIFAAIGFVVVLLPIFSRSWRTVIESTPIARWVFHDYSTFSGLAMVNLYILMALFLIRSWQIKSLPGGAAFSLTYRNVVDMELYPRTKREELAYWTDISFGFVGTTLWLFLPFGALAYFINIGS